MKARKTAWVATPLLALALALTGCVGEGAGGEGTNESGTDDGKNKGRETVLEITDTPGSLDEFAGALEDAESTRCAATADGWVSEGEVTNPTDAAQNYRLYVSFMEKNETRGLMQVDLNEVAPGASATWNAEAELSGEAIECVLRVERFTTAG